MSEDAGKNLEEVLDKHDADFLEKERNPLLRVSLIADVSVRGKNLQAGCYDYDARNKTFRHMR